MMTKCNFKYTIFTFFLLIFLSVSNAEPFLYFDYIDDSNGITNPQIEDIAQDKDGYIWFATQAGLFRFDGQSSHAYRSDLQAGSLLDGDIFDILVTEKNELWVATNTKGIARFDPRTQTFQHINDKTDFAKIAHYRTKKLIEFENKLWVHSDGGIEALDFDSLESTRYPIMLNEAEVHATQKIESFTLHKEALYLVFENKLYRRLPNENAFTIYEFESYRHYAYEPNDKHYSVFSTESGLYVHTESGVYFIDSIGKTITKEPLNFQSKEYPLINIRNIVVDVHGTNWVVTRSHGIKYRFKNKNNYSSVSIGNGRNQLNTNQLLSVYIDNESNIWVGTDGIYVAKFRAPQDQFQFYSNHHINDIDLHTNNIWRILDWNDKKYVSTHKGLFEFNDDHDAKVAFEPILVGPNYHFAYDMEVVNDALLIGTRFGLIEYRANGTARNVLQNYLDLSEETKDLEKAIVQIEQSDRYLFIGKFDGLLVVDKIDETIKHYSTSPDAAYQLKDNWTWLLRYDTTNEWLWVGSTSGVELISFSDSDNPEYVQKLNENLAVITEAIFDIYIQNNGEAWIATELGLYRFTQDKKLVAYEHFAENNVRSIQIVDDIIWASTAKGLIKTSLNDLDVYDYFVLEDGIYNLKNVEGASYYSAKTNLLYFGGDRGLVAINPNKKPPELNVSKPVLEGLYLLSDDNNRDIKYQVLANGKLSYNQNSLRFHYSYLDYKAPHRILYQYRLVGTDSDWSDITDNHVITYSSLPSGLYEFQVRARTANNIWTADETLAAFEIQPAWWFSKLALLTYLLLGVVATVFGVIYASQIASRKRSLQIQRKKEEFISSYLEYSMFLSSMINYQTMARYFLRRVIALTNASSGKLKQTVNKHPHVVDLYNQLTTRNTVSTNVDVVFDNNSADLFLYGVTDEDISEQIGDINLLYQQLALAQLNNIERTKYNWNNFYDAKTGLLNKNTFLSIVKEELKISDQSLTSPILYGWCIDSATHKDNNLLERIQFMKYGETLKEHFGPHIIASSLYINEANPYFEHAGEYMLMLGHGKEQEQIEQTKRRIMDVESMINSDLSLSDRYGQKRMITIFLEDQLVEMINYINKK